MVVQQDYSPRSSVSSILENVNSKDCEVLDSEDDVEQQGPVGSQHKGYQKVGEYRYQGRSKRRLFVFAGALSVITLLIFTAAFKSVGTGGGAFGQKPLSLQDMRDGMYQPHTQSIEWIDSDYGSHGQYLVKDNGKWYITSWGEKDNKTTVLSDPQIEYKGEKYYVLSLELNKHQDKAILKTNSEKNWRYSSFALYWILDIDTGSVTPVDTTDHKTKLALTKWSPRGDRVAFVKENNIHLRYVGGKDDGKVKKITKDGGKQVFYGVPDWVYEEEVFQGPEALWWSQSGEYLAFLRTNESAVPEFPIPYFVQHDTLQEYPEVVKIKYPKPGFPNPEVSILFLEIESEDFYSVQTETDPVEDDMITEVVWANNQVIVRMTNRESDLFKLSLVNPKTREGRVVRETNLDKTAGWFEVTHDMTFVPKDPKNNRPEDGYIDTIIVDGYDHMAYFAPLDAPKPKQILTKGNWEVIDAPSAVDLSTNTVYFESTKKDPTERHLYSVQLDGSGLRPITNTEEPGHYKVSFSSDAQYALLTYEGPNIPWQKVIDLHSGNPVNDGDLVESNSLLHEDLAKYEYPTVSFGQIQVDVDQEGNPIMANSVELLPANFDRSKKYPVLFYVYGGPVSQMVNKKFSVNFQKIMTSHDVIVVTVDGRGTGKMGRAFRSVVRDQLGKYEVADQITAAKTWANLSYVDESRIAIWGWSYGGFMALKTLETDAGKTFNYGMAVAPVTDWRFYDSIYTERYMHTPQHNKKGYEQSRIHNATALAQAERFLVMHGTGDDNVHLQNTLNLLDKLDKDEVENYDIHVFPDSDHGISHHNANTVVYDKLERWINNAFNSKFKDL